MRKLFIALAAICLLVSCQSDEERFVSQAKEMLLHTLEITDNLMFSRFGADSTFFKDRLGEAEAAFEACDGLECLDETFNSTLVPAIDYCLDFARTSEDKWHEAIGDLSGDYPEAWERYGGKLESLAGD